MKLNVARAHSLSCLTAAEHISLVAVCTTLVITVVVAIVAILVVAYFGRESLKKQWRKCKTCCHSIEQPPPSSQSGQGDEVSICMCGVRG